MIFNACVAAVLALSALTLLPAPAAEPPATPSLVLSNQSAMLRLETTGPRAGALSLQKGESILLHGLELAVDGSMMNAPAKAARVVEQSSGPDWNYVSLDLAAAFGGKLVQFRRHILAVQPDLFVVLDELKATNAVTFRWRLQAPVVIQAPDPWPGYTIDSQEAKVSGRFLCPRPLALRSGTNGAPALDVTTTNAVEELQCFTVLLVEPPGSTRVLRYRGLSSDTAVGARIHRGGYPTLVAFRRHEVTGEADLTGLKFNAPVTVHVTRPRPLRQP